MDETLWTSRQAAACLNLKRSTVYDWVAKGILPHVVLNPGSKRSCIRFRPTDIRRFIESRTSGGGR